MSEHVSVLLNEICEFAEITQNGIYVDCTFGAGGYSREILKKADCQVVAFDRDPSVKKFVDVLQKEFPGKLSFINSEFSKILEKMPEELIGKIDAVIFDLGVSSMQIDDAERGFSFMHDGQIDMRMGVGARDVQKFINEATEEEIANVIFEFGEERNSRRIAHNIVEARKKSAILRTCQLADIVRKSFKLGESKKMKIDSATKTFQAFRIWANDELEEVKNALEAAVKLLKKNGKIIVVSFHGLEDVIVKKFFLDHSGRKPAISRYAPDFSDLQLEKNDDAIIEIVTRKTVKPTEEEIFRNPRARSARLRVAKKLI